MKHSARTWRAVAAVAITPAVLSACSRATTQPPAQNAAERSEFEALYEARQDSARMRFTQADVDFMSGMIQHHAQAIRMSRLAPDRASSGQVRTLAARIINSQTDEIRLMQRWLRDRDQAVPEVDLATGQVIGGAMGHGMAHGAHMPGMLTPEQMSRLEAAEGAAFDRLYLEYMIQHHQGAITMVHELATTDGAMQDDSVFKLASDVQVDQRTEIARMELMLNRMKGER